MKAAGEKLAFFRQSGWLVIATVAGGVFMSAVHIVVSKPMRPAEYAVFFALLRVFLLMGFPAGGLQTIFAQEAAAVLSPEDSRKLSAATRAVLQGTFAIWVLMALGVFIDRHQLLAALKIANPAALWVTVALGLASLWTPLFRGLLQGRQNFAGLGWVLMLDGIGRFTAIVLIVHLGGQAAGGMTGALIGQMISFSAALWLVRDIVFGRGSTFAWRPWLERVIPLTLGVGVVLFMSTVDVVYVQAVFGKDEAPYYAPAAMIGLALVTFTTPLAAVMFPKIVQSVARTEKTNALRQALVSTALLSIAAAVLCSLLPGLPLRIIYFRTPDYWISAPLVPWFAWALVPLMLGNVLVSNLLARQRFQVVPWLVLVALGYGAVLLGMRDRLVLFSRWDVRNPAALVHQWEAHRDPVSAWIWGELSPEQREALTSALVGSDQSGRLVLSDLNQLVKGRSIYSPGAFAHVKLSEATSKLLSDNAPEDRDERRLNRLLLQDAYPNELTSNRAKIFRSFKLVIANLGIFSLALFLVALWGTVRARIPESLVLPSAKA